MNYDVNRIFEDAAIKQITAELSKTIDSKLEQIQELQFSPYITGIDGLAKYLGIGLTLAQVMKNSKEIPYSQRGRQIWFKKSDVEKFITKNKA